jgi:predicted peroxiredoxin
MRHILRFATVTVLFATTTPAYSAAVTTQDCKTVANMATNAYRQNNFQQAEELFKQAIALADKLPGGNATLAKAALETNLGATYVAQNKLSDAEAAYQRALKLKETSVGKNSPLFADTLEHYASLMRRQKRTQEAEDAEVQAELIRLNKTTANFTVQAPAAANAEHPEASSPLRSEVANFHSNAQAVSATRVVALSDMDKSRLSNPTTLESLSWRGTEATGARVQGDHPFDYERELRPLEDKYRLTAEETERVVRTVLEGGALFETSNGCLMLTANQVNPTTFGHTEMLHMAEQPGAARSVYIVSDGDTRLNATLIATTGSSMNRLATETTRPETAHPTKPVPHARKIVVMVKNFSLMPEIMWEATREAQRMLRDGADVSILLTMDAVNAADTNKVGNVTIDPRRFDSDVRDGKLTTPQEALKQFIQSGGKLLASERYAKNFSLVGSPNLMAGTQLVSDDEIDRLLMDPNNKVLTY